ncbi:hypothetical protein DYB32_004766 [Aphanomyces invadans]|uniref:Carboxypeptidase n=1 Tax=Aphanomyces invadans TaxID=157072 RepID=A0A3R6VXJ1_9STRA|nr:hypothetical protein DYB32_004766 [Aphanomyces invadans]
MPHYSDSRAINFDHYAGHIRLPSNGQKMFYWLVESESNPLTDPLVLWLNGGPGCSSLGGFFNELGPFVVESDLSVKRNPYAWNRKANVVFLDSPAGVGFSQPLLDASKYNDEFTASRIHEFLEEFLAMYPTYSDRPLYITGESYAGMYIPYLVQKLVELPIPHLKLTGWSVASAYLDYFYTHALMSLKAYELGRRVCGATGVSGCFYGGNECPTECLAVLVEAGFGQESMLDPSDIFGDVCVATQSATLTTFMAQQATRYRRTSATKNIRPLTHRGVVGPCQMQYTTKYLQLYAVQHALHVYDVHVNWAPCNDHVAARYTRSRSSLPKYKSILQSGLKALIYSGDADATVPFLGTERWLSSAGGDLVTAAASSHGSNQSRGLQLPILAPWQAWFGPDKQLAGYSTRYTNVTFTTVKGAGHMVPATRPLHALFMIECFLHGDHQCASFTYPKDALEYLSGADPSVAVGSDADRSGALIPWAITAVVVVLESVIGLVFWAKKEPPQYVELSVEKSTVSSRSLSTTGLYR